MEPEVLRLPKSMQLSYNLPHRNFDTCLYPVKAPNGSSIVIYGHNEGIRILWYARSPSEQLRNTKQDGTRANPTEPFPEIAKSHNQIIAYKDVSLGSSALHVSHIPLRSDSIVADAKEPPLLKTHMVLAVACADLTLKAILCPLEVPHSDTTDDVQVTSISDANLHQELITAIALTISPTREEVNQEHESKTVPRNQSKTRNKESAEQSETKTRWCCLLASTSTTGKGLLAVHRFYLSNDESGQNVEELSLLQRKFTNCCLTRSTMSFNPSNHSSERCSKLLITCPSNGCVKIYDIAVSSPSGKRRRGSTATDETTGNSTQAQEQQSLYTARCCITLYAGFVSQDSTLLLPRRKEILDARWILQGRSILVLLEDGEWGIWDIEAAGPLPPTSSHRLLKEQSNTSGLSGGSLTKFAVRGRIAGTSSTQRATKPDDTTQGSSLAPMTPHTRKTRSDGLFKGSQNHASMDLPDTMRAKGNIAVHPKQSEGAMSEESIVLTYCNTNILIPSIQALWRAETGNGRSLGTSSSKNQGVLAPIRLGGENIRKVFLLSEQQTSKGLFNGSDMSPEYLIATTSRIIIHTAQRPESGMTGSGVASIPDRSLTKRHIEADQALLRQGELDVEGMDRILETLEKGQNETTVNAATRTGKKSVGFVPRDEDGDVEMVTPSMARSSKPFAINRSSTTGRRNLFT